MTDSLTFSPWEVESQVPETCPLCTLEPPIFEFTLRTETVPSGEPETLHGYSCLKCGQQLLAAMQDLTMAKWAEPPLSRVKIRPR